MEVLYDQEAERGRGVLVGVDQLRGHLLVQFGEEGGLPVVEGPSLEGIVEERVDDRVADPLGSPFPETVSLSPSRFPRSWLTATSGQARLP